MQALFRKFFEQMKAVVTEEQLAALRQRYRLRRRK
jgi:hypothetical protein